MTDARETLWSCSNVKIRNAGIRGDYFGMNSEDVKAENIKLDGNYAFDGGKNITVRNAVMLSKDAFWNTENVTVYDSYICGEYLGWNSRNLTFENCTIESNQGLCYIDTLTMKNCRLINTTLAFEYVKYADAEIRSRIDSVFNPYSGLITAPEIKTLIIEKDQVDPAMTRIICDAVGERQEVVEWRRPGSTNMTLTE